MIHTSFIFKVRITAEGFDEFQSQFEEIRDELHARYEEVINTHTHEMLRRVFNFHIYDVVEQGRKSEKDLLEVDVYVKFTLLDPTAWTPLESLCKLVLPPSVEWKECETDSYLYAMNSTELLNSRPHNIDELIAKVAIGVLKMEWDRKLKQNSRFMNELLCDLELAVFVPRYLLTKKEKEMIYLTLNAIYPNGMDGFLTTLYSDEISYCNKVLGHDRKLILENILK